MYIETWMYKVNEIIIIVENKFGNLRGIYSSKEVLHQLIFFPFQNNVKKVQVGKDQEKAQSEKDSHSKNRGGKKPN